MSAKFSNRKESLKKDKKAIINYPMGHDMIDIC